MNNKKRKLDDKYSEYYDKSIIDCKLLEKHKLYGFDNNAKYKFVLLKFKSLESYNCVKNMFYYSVRNEEDDTYERKLKSNGIYYEKTNIKLYEANIPPLLRYFHIRKISPSGWVSIKQKDVKKTSDKTTTCDIELTIKQDKIRPLPKKEIQVPYKICSFDIEASSSHGDFPLPIKTYKKLATNIIDYWDSNFEDLSCEDEEYHKAIIECLVKAAFGFSIEECFDVDEVYPKYYVTKENFVNNYLGKIFTETIPNIKHKVDKSINTINSYFNDEDDDEDLNISCSKTKKKTKKIKQTDNIINLLNNTQYDREEKKDYITEIFDTVFPQLEGDKVTFIGSTFKKYGDDKPYLNHCIALNSCDDIADSEIERYKTEKDVLLAWTELIQRENPDFIIGYNIFGFDYKFMYDRAKENNIIEQFLKLSRNKNEICGRLDWKTKKYKLKESKLVIASGAHALYFADIPGRVQVDLYNYFRRGYNLSSYKLDYVAGHFIGDKVKNIDIYDDNTTEITSKNLTGLSNGNFIHFEEIGHSTQYYNNGAKYEVFDIDESTGTFWVKGQVDPDEDKTIKWCLAKDDVTPQDIFRMTNEGPTERAIIAKYCIQDCNLVQHLLRKNDVITGFIEMAKICSVPFDFLVMRGQGIKLFSFIAQKCREANTLIPVLEKKDDGGYEGAIVLPPKCGLYLDEPVACVDYSSLYPSSMISENLSHDSKVWSKEYDLDGNLINTTGVTDKSGKFIYDNLSNYEYVNVKYDTYEYKRKTPKSAAKKTKIGSKICRFAQFPEGKLAIMPRILSDLLAARKATRECAIYKTITTKTCKYIGLIIKDEEEIITLKNKKGILHQINKNEIIKTEETFDDFMKNILDKRQLAIKVTANSLYGQCGARTSSFYEKDVAASTTAIGRKLLTYGKRIIEEVYGDKICETKYGTVHSHAEYIYGDTDSVFMSFKLTDLDGNKIIGKEALKHTIELAKEAGQLATRFLKAPHDLEYEKTFMPFCLLSKKRYVGMLYEEDINKCYRKSMGIVLKRRDNAPIVKDVYGGIIDILMNEKDVEKAINFTKECMQNIIDEKYPLEKLIITKSLRGFYKKPKQIAHKTLADRMGKRDPGNKPSPGDRIPYVYIQKKGKVTLQGDRIEHPNYIRKHKLKPDYGFYITNQIMKPVQQVFALVLEQIPLFQNRRNRFEKCINNVKKRYDDEEKLNKKIQTLRNKEIEILLFKEYILTCDNIRQNQRSFKNFFF